MLVVHLPLGKTHCSLWLAFAQHICETVMKYGDPRKFTRTS